jgi:hypothetical protein
VANSLVSVAVLSVVRVGHDRPGQPLADSLRAANLLGRALDTADGRSHHRRRGAPDRSTWADGSPARRLSVVKKSSDEERKDRLGELGPMVLEIINAHVHSF